MSTKTVNLRQPFLFDDVTNNTWSACASLAGSKPQNNIRRVLTAAAESFLNTVPRVCGACSSDGLRRATTKTCTYFPRWLFFFFCERQGCWVCSNSVVFMVRRLGNTLLNSWDVTSSVSVFCDNKGDLQNAAAAPLSAVVLFQCFFDVVHSTVVCFIHMSCLSVHQKFKTWSWLRYLDQFAAIFDTRNIPLPRSGEIWWTGSLLSEGICARNSLNALVTQCMVISPATHS